MIIDVADAVTQELNEHEFILPFTAERDYVPRFELKEMDTLRVTVVPSELSMERLGRDRTQMDGSIDVAVQQKFSRGDVDEIDPLVRLVNEIGEYFRLRRLVHYSEAHWIKTTYRVLYSQEHWDELRQFTSVVCLTFRMAKKVL